MSRKKVNLYVIIGIISFYLISVLGAYKVAAQYIESDYQRTMEHVSDYIETNYVGRDVKDIHTTTEKITKRFNSINQVEMEGIDYEKDK